VRVICRDCAEPELPPAAALAESRIDPALTGEYQFARGRGCALCRGTGYRGRKAVGELLIMNDELREMIVAREPARRLKEVARRAGTVALRDAALELVKSGTTTLEEVNRVTFVA
jgi:general secretion pathway protein E